MQDIKNFKPSTPTPEQIETYTLSHGQIPLFLKSEDGQDWYECQSLFSDDTVKIMYDEQGIIWGVVTEPIPQRGNTYAVSVFFPVNLSVAEINKEECPVGCTNDKTWRYQAGVISKIEEIPLLQAKRKTTQELAVDAYILQCAVDAGNATAEQASQLAELKQFIASTI
ncbi:tail fiber assembly protein [Enterobacter quasiroggenkampii]|uniref:tail fiber assembly protein n=1 Tax=Enterobacter quasiroggenkampii TaxID=2497436 RepID=UPI003754E173